MHVDRNTGIIEMFMEKLQDEDEGTYTFQLQDGKAVGHSTLVLIGDGTNSVKHQLKDFPAPFNANTHGTKVVAWKAVGIASCISKLESNFQLILSIVLHFVDTRFILSPQGRLQFSHLIYKQVFITKILQ